MAKRALSLDERTVVALERIAAGVELLAGHKTHDAIDGFLRNGQLRDDKKASASFWKWVELHPCQACKVHLLEQQKAEKKDGQ